MAKSGLKVALFIHDGGWASTIYQSLDLFQTINLRSMTQFFRCDVVTPTSKPVRLYNGRTMMGDKHTGNEDKYDLILLAHHWGNFDFVPKQFPQVTPWLCQQYEHEAISAGVNGGIYWAAQSGLLEQRRATTYWRYHNDFQERFPNVLWQDNQALVEDGGIYSSNGNNASMDLTMHLVEKLCGAEMAAGLARDVTFDFRRSYDMTLLNIAGFRHHRDEGIHKAQNWLEKHYDEKVEFEVLADKVGMSKRTFIRRFQKATGEKPTRYLQMLRVEAAKHQLINSDDSIKTISLNVGYRDFGYFAEVFKSVTELSPTQFRVRFRPLK